MRLLLVEDDQVLGATLKKALEKHAYGVDWVQDGDSALVIIENSQFMAMVLDINLPKLSGLDVLKNIRQKKNDLPVIILTACDTSLQKVEGLDNGADDYLVKPFDLEELLARLRAVLRRRDGRMDTIIRCGSVELDISAMIVRNDGQTVIMTAKELRILKLLMERAGKYVTKADMEYALYSAEDAVESNTVEVTIYNLRKKFGSEFIETMRGVGYRINP